jgi:ATP-dependent Clp protease adaptor protein ClpS
MPKTANPKEKTITRDGTEVKRPPLYKVILMNDDYTTMEFVVMVLIRVLAKVTAPQNASC